PDGRSGAGRTHRGDVGWPARASGPYPRLEPMLLDPVPEALLGDAEQPRRAHLHTTRASERREDQLSLEVVDRLVERAPGWRRALLDAGRLRSEERRVGEAGSSRWCVGQR